jgi:hypothetical protein
MEDNVCTNQATESSSSENGTVAATFQAQ